LVSVHIRRDGRKRLSSFFAAGHAGWADEGEDVVCAAVSAILQSAWLGLSEVASVDVAGSRDAGELHLRWPKAKRCDPAVRAIVATAALSLERIAMQYPEHVAVVYERERERVNAPHADEGRRTMTDIYKPINDDRNNGASNAGSEGYAGSGSPEGSSSGDAGRALLAGLVGGVVSAAGYLVYQRLPDDQKAKLQAQVRSLVESRVNELRGRFNI